MIVENNSKNIPVTKVEDSKNVELGNFVNKVPPPILPSSIIEKLCNK